MTIEDAFREVCDHAEESETRYVSLYCAEPFYGEPEEGGWWGCDVRLVATQGFPTISQADAAVDRIEALVKQLQAGAQASYGDMCLSQLESCGWNGEEAQSRYGEVDGAADYFVVIEDHPGSAEHLGCRHYE